MINETEPVTGPSGRIYQVPIIRTTFQPRAGASLAQSWLPLRRPHGWRLAPAYDLNPVPTDIKPRVLTTAIDLDDGTASRERATEVAGHFELDVKTARAIVAEM